MRKALSSLLAAIAVFMVLQGCSTPGPLETLYRESAGLDAIDSLVQREVDWYHIPGAVLRIQQGDSLLYEKAFGYAQRYGYGMRMLTDAPPMSTGHLFDLASLTKVYATTFAVMMLVDDGTIGLDDPVYRWLPEFDTQERKREITIRHLLTHSAGLYQWKPTYYFINETRSMAQYAAGLPLRFTPGLERNYSDLGFMILAEIVQRASGQPLDRYLEERLYEPLGLSNTLFNPLEKGVDPSRIAATSHGNPFERQMVYDDEFVYKVYIHPEYWDEWRTYTLRGEVNDGNAWYAGGGVAGHAGLFSTAAELQKLTSLLLDRGRYGDEQLISETVVDTFLTKDRFGNGLGWAMDPAVFSAEGVPEGSFGHTGFTGTNVVVVPEFDLSVIILTNRQNMGPEASGFYFNLGTLRQRIVDIVLSQVH